MIELLYRRKVVREFLNKYSTNLWNGIIPLVFEIGILNLQTSFNTLNFSKEELTNILSK
jgi:hypothetical protein